MSHRARQIVAPRLVTYGPTHPHHHPNYKQWVKRCLRLVLPSCSTNVSHIKFQTPEWNAEHSARHTASLYASLRSAFHALLCALRAQRVAETELGMQLRYTPRSAPLRAAQLRCANGWIKDSSVLPPAGGSSLVVFALHSKASVAQQPASLVASLRSASLRSADQRGP